LANPLTLKTEATCSSETSVDLQQTTRHFIPEDGTLQQGSFCGIDWAMRDALLSSAPCTITFLKVFILKSTTALFLNYLFKLIL
jgi:hypothetical protein